MSETPERSPKPLVTFEFDEVTVFTLKAESNPEADVKPPAGKDAPILTVKVDEMTEFVVKAVPASELDVPSRLDQP